MPLAPITKLEAVNAMLADLGDRPVASLVGSLRLDVTTAITTLDNISRTLQLRGWWFNTDTRTINLTGDQYLVPVDVGHLEVLSGGPTSGDAGAPHLVVRAGLLFDRTNNTNEFPGAPPVEVLVHTLIDFDELPAVAREYIYASASIRMQSRTLGSREISADLKDQAEAALALLHEEDLDNENFDQTFSPHFIRLMHNR